VSALDPTTIRLGDWLLNASPPRAPLPGEYSCLFVPMPLPSMANSRNHWKKKADQVAHQRNALCHAWVKAKLPRGHRPAKVLLCRVSERELDDDNLQGALKHCRDQVAEMCGFNDRAKVWEYDQDSGEQTGVRVEVWWT